MRRSESAVFRQQPADRAPQERPAVARSPGEGLDDAKPVRIAERVQHGGQLDVLCLGVELHRGTSIRRLSYFGTMVAVPAYISRLPVLSRLIREEGPNVPDQVTKNAARPSTAAASAITRWSPARLSAVVAAAYILELARR